VALPQGCLCLGCYLQLFHLLAQRVMILMISDDTYILPCTAVLSALQWCSSILPVKIYIEPAVSDSHVWRPTAAFLSHQEQLPVGVHCHSCHAAPVAARQEALLHGR